MRVPFVPAAVAGARFEDLPGAMGDGQVVDGTLRTIDLVPTVDDIGRRPRALAELAVDHLTLAPDEDLDRRRLVAEVKPLMTSSSECRPHHVLQRASHLSSATGAKVTASRAT